MTKRTIQMKINEHEAYLHSFAIEHGLTYDELMDGIRTYLEFGEGVTLDGYTWMNFEAPEEFWDHYEALMGRRVAKSLRSDAFDCEC